jgi:hypothetical protein
MSCSDAETLSVGEKVGEKEVSSHVSDTIELKGLSQYFTSPTGAAILQLSSGAISSKDLVHI